MTGRAHRLKSLSVTEISLVDAPANPGAVHVLFKRKDATMPSEAELAAAKKAKDASVLDRLLTRLGLGKRGESGTVDPDMYSDAAANAIDQACEALTKSINSILADTAVSDKATAITKSLADFRAYSADATAEQIEKAMRDVAQQITKSGKDDSMPTADEQVAALTKQVAALQAEIDKAKMSPAHAKHYATLSSEDAKAAFMAKSTEERDAACASATKKRDEGEGEGEVTVALTKANDQIASLSKRIAAFEAEKELDLFKRRASDIGIAEAQAEVLLKASKGDASSFDQLLALVKSATTAARTGAVFKEFGSASNAGTASGEVNAKAEELRKADPKLSLIAARVQVRKSNLELAQRERDEERQGAGAA